MKCTKGVVLQKTKQKYSNFNVRLMNSLMRVSSKMNSCISSTYVGQYSKKYKTKEKMIN